MLQTSPETQSKYKPRKVSAIRQFPRGCGPKSAKLRQKPVSETSSLVGSEDGEVAVADDVLMASNVGETIVLPPPALDEAQDVPGLVDSLIPEVAEPPDLQITKLEVMQVLENKVEPRSQIVKLEVHPVSKNNDVMENEIESVPEKMKLELPQVMEESTEMEKLQHRHCYSKIYGPPRRKKVSAIRQFPPGCRSNSNQPVFTVPSPVNDKSLVGISSEPVIRLQIGSPKSRNFYEDKKAVLQQQEMAGSSTLAVSTNNILHADEIMLREKQSRRIDISPVVPDAENSLNREKVIMNQAIEIYGSVKVSSSEKVRVADRKNSDVIMGKETMIDKSGLVRSNSDKNFRIQGAMGKSLVKSGSNVKSLMKSGSSKFFVRSSSDKKLDGSTVDRAVTNIQTKANASNPSHLFVKSQSGNKRMVEKSIVSVEKSIGNENEINQDSIKKRKLSVTNYSPAKSDDFLAATAERMIIQALMAAENCPWKNPKKHSAVSSDSFVPKRKVRKEKRFIEKNPSPKEYFSFKQKSKDLTVYDDNMLEEDNKLSLTMTPYVPPESSHKGDDNEEVVDRHKVKKALRLFQLICRKLLQGEESKSKRFGKINRIDLQAASILKDNGEWVNSGEPILGHVPGVEIGDEFHFRVELSIVGLHRPFQGGIDFTKRNGMLLANSIVASGGYQDDMDSSDVLIYSGSGGTSAVGGDKQQGDQKLERGNLSLKNSIDTQTPVRVIHGFKEKASELHDAKGKLVSTFTYDGLYQVESYWQEAGTHGFNVFKFQLRRMAGQPEIALKELRRSAKLKIREGLCVKDISQGKEKIPIAVVNTIDNDQPTSFKYITKSIYPSWYAKTAPKGCDCTDGCSDSENCACAVKNGGEIPFNFNGAIVQAKPLIYECGPSCKCPPSCHNRVSQRGLRMQLEIFKTKERGWGVRSLKSITSGSFICEYVGELLQDGEAEQRTNDEYLFDIGHNYDDRSLWEDLPNLIPGLQSSSDCDTVESIGFTIDAVEYGNVGRFINHSCSPNLYAQNVLYDHDDKRMPHIMFFAVDNIPPLQELTYHYNYTIGQVRDSEGNIKEKACHCGSPECCGRLY